MERVNATAIGTIKFFTSKFDSISSSAQVCPAAAQTRLTRVGPLSLFLSRCGRGGQTTIYGLTNVARDELRHLEHADLALAVEYGPHRVVGVDLSSLGFVL